MKLYRNGTDGVFVKSTPEEIDNLVNLLNTGIPGEDQPVQLTKSGLKKLTEKIKAALCDSVGLDLLSYNKIREISTESRIPQETIESVLKASLSYIEDMFERVSPVDAVMNVLDDYTICT